MPPKEITLGSLFDGIAGFPYAAGLHGIRSVWASEIEPFCIKVSQKHFPEMKHLGSITDIHACYYVTHFSGYKCEMYINNHKDISVEPLDIITFGSPCQDLSVAGKRKGLTGERSGLFMEAIRIIREMREATNGLYPTFAVWENVPGAFSSNRGQDFRAVLEEIMETEIPMPKSGKWANAGMVRGNGRSVAWRVLDAQYWGVPQRRRRIFLVADFAGQRAPEILFEPEGVSGHTAESRKARQEAAASAGDGTPGAGRINCTRESIAGAVSSKWAKGTDGPAGDEHYNLFAQLYDMTHADEVMRPVTPGLAPTLNARMGTGGNQVPVTLAVRTTQTSANRHGISEEKAHTLDGAQGQAVCSIDCRNLYENEEVSDTLQCKATGGYSLNYQNPVRIGYAVRRLTPIECLRLQGFPDNWLTDIPGYSDTAAYKAIGNSLAIPPTKWIMGRIKAAIMGELCPKMRI